MLVNNSHTYDFFFIFQLCIAWKRIGLTLWKTPVASTRRPEVSRQLFGNLLRRKWPTSGPSKSSKTSSWTASATYSLTISSPRLMSNRYSATFQKYTPQIGRRIQRAIYLHFFAMIRSKVKGKSFIYLMAPWNRPRTFDFFWDPCCYTVTCTNFTNRM